MSKRKERVERELLGLAVDISRRSEELKKKQKELRELIKKEQEEEDETLFDALNKK